MTMSKYFEIRDEGTFIPVVAHRIQPGDYLARRAGFSGIVPSTLVTRLTDLKSAYNNDEGQFIGRTMNIAIKHIHDNWTGLKSEDVIDVQYILGETDTKKRSERHVTTTNESL
jgi:hypothetical protein